VFVRIWRLVAVLLVALLMGTSFAHVLELPAKMQYDGALYVTLQKTLYVEWGPPNFGGFLEPGAILATILLAFAARQQRPAFWLTLIAVVSLLLAFPVVFFWLVNPANAAFRDSTAAALPADWVGWRERWEYGHAIRFALHLMGFAALLLSTLTVGRQANAPPE
jgi:hypothetical protein